MTTTSTTTETTATATATASKARKARKSPEAGLQAEQIRAALKVLGPLAAACAKDRREMRLQFQGGALVRITTQDCGAAIGAAQFGTFSDPASLETVVRYIERSDLMRAMTGVNGACPVVLDGNNVTIGGKPVATTSKGADEERNADTHTILGGARTVRAHALVDAAELVASAHAVLPAVSKDTTRPHMCGALVEVETDDDGLVRLIGTDGHRLTISATENVEAPVEGSLHFNSAALRAIAGLPATGQVTLGTVLLNGTAGARIAQHGNVTIVDTTFEPQFPAWRAIMPQDKAFTVTFDTAAALIEQVETVVGFFGKHAQERGAAQFGVVIDVQLGADAADDSVTIFGQHPEVGEMRSAKLPVRIEGDRAKADGFKIGLAHGYLCDAVRACEYGDNIAVGIANRYNDNSMADALGPVEIADGGYTLSVVMPMRV